jgi:hypothetical protein
MPNITNALIENAPRPERAKQLILRDDLLPGFAVRLTPTSAAFIVEKRVNGRVRRGVQFPRSTHLLGGFAASGFR